MKLSSVLQLLNIVFLALFGAAGWRLVNEWRKNREERHRVELALRNQEIESWKANVKSLKTSHRHELEKCEIQISKLTDDNQRLSQQRDERAAILEQQIEFLKAQAPAGVSANFDALKKWHEEQLSIFEKKLQGSQSVLLEEQSRHQAALHSRDEEIEQLRRSLGNARALTGAGIDIRTILAGPLPAQREHLQQDREAVAKQAAEFGTDSDAKLIDALGHWDSYVRNTAAQALASR